jgi:hypothetical protein
MKSERKYWRNNKERMKNKREWDKKKIKKKND